MFIFGCSRASVGKMHCVHHVVPMLILGCLNGIISILQTMVHISVMVITGGAPGGQTHPATPASWRGTHLSAYAPLSSPLTRLCELSLSRSAEPAQILSIKLECRLVMPVDSRVLQPQWTRQSLPGSIIKHQLLYIRYSPYSNCAHRGIST